MKTKIYVTTDGNKRIYRYPDGKYKQSTAFRKPKCPLMGCYTTLRHIKMSDKGKIIRIGYICINCNSVFIDNQEGVKIFRIIKID